MRTYIYETVKDIQIEDILIGVPDDAVAVILKATESEVPTIGLRQSFLEKFQAADKIRIADEYLRPAWGYLSVEPKRDEGLLQFMARVVGFEGENSLTGWKWRTADNRHSVPGLAKDIAKAKEFNRRLRVEVTTL